MGIGEDRMPELVPAWIAAAEKAKRAHAARAEVEERDSLQTLARPFTDIRDLVDSLPARTVDQVPLTLRRDTWLPGCWAFG